MTTTVIYQSERVGNYGLILFCRIRGGLIHEVSPDGTTWVRDLAWEEDNTI